MLPKAKMESVGDKGYQTTFESSPPHIVVACPSCRTKFAVETAAVAALETPRFHCSRCDDIFVLKDNLSASNPSGDIEIRSLTRGDRLPLSHATRTTTPQVRKSDEESIKASDFSFGASPFVNFDPLPAPSSLRVSEPAASLPETTNSPATEISLLAKSTLEEPAPSREEAPQLEIESPPRFEMSEPMAVVPPTSSRKFILSDIPPTQGNIATATVQTTSQPLESSTVQETRSYRPLPAKNPQQSAGQLARASETGRRLSRAQGLISLATPVLCSFLALLGISYCARLSPQSVEAVFRFILPSFATESVPTLPPASLGVRDLKLTFKKTRNREIVAIVSGVAINNNGKRADGVELEALGFNERGEIVAHIRAPLRSALHGEKIEELSIETIKSYQGTLNAQSSSIEPREAVPFSIALLPTEVDMDSAERPVDLARVRYFSARIFSVTSGR